MKTRLIFFILLSSPYLFSQDELGIPKLKPVNDYWSIGYYASGNISIANGYDVKPIQPGAGGTLEFVYNDTKKELVFSVAYNRFNSGIENTHFETFNFNLGPRFVFKNEKFVEVTAGMLTIRKVTRYYSRYDDDYYYDHSINSEINLCISAAAGAKININNNSDFVFKLRLTSSFQSELFTYLSVNVGLAFNNKKDKKIFKKQKADSYFGAALFGGANNPAIVSQWDYNWGINAGFEFNYKTSPKIELIMDLNYNSLSRIERYEISKEKFGSVTGGVRLFINENNITSFLEFGAGLYSFYTLPNGPYTEYSEYTDDYAGFNAGTGTKLKLTNLLDVIAKGNINFIFSEPYSQIPNFLSLQGGLRFNL